VNSLPHFRTPASAARWSACILNRSRTPAAARPYCCHRGTQPVAFTRSRARARESSRWPPISRCLCPSLYPRLRCVPFFKAFFLPLVCGRCFGTFPAPCGRKLVFRLRRPVGLRSLQKNQTNRRDFFGSPAKPALGALVHSAPGAPQTRGRKELKKCITTSAFWWGT
jgi:hypothetical protein